MHGHSRFRVRGGIYVATPVPEPKITRSLHRGMYARSIRMYPYAGKVVGYPTDNGSGSGTGIRLPRVIGSP